MILLFLGTWRNTLVVALSIPLSIFCSIICLYALGQTINAMTLGGLALAVGILVDDATVEIENIDRNLHMRKPLVKAILDGAQQIAVPAFVSTLCICIVFVPIFFLEGTAKFLFGPLAMAVMFAMLASYFLSRTVVPTFVHYLLLGKPVLHDDGKGHADAGDVFWRVHVAFNRHFERFRSGYVGPRQGAHRAAARPGGMIAAIAPSARRLLPGRDFFPRVDAGQFRLHVRAPDGTRIEETERYFTQVENIIRQVIPADELETIIDNIGLPNGSTGLAFSDTATVGRPTARSWSRSRRRSTAPPGPTSARSARAQPRDAQLHLLHPALGHRGPDPQLRPAGPDRPADRGPGPRRQLRPDPGARGPRRQDPGGRRRPRPPGRERPALMVNVDRTRAEQLGLTQGNVANNLLISLSGTARSPRATG
jgi:multidrug efflux pump subunit AcrB